MMKKIFLYMLCIVMVVMTVAGCGNDNPETEDAAGYDVYFYSIEDNGLVTEKYDVQNNSILKTVYLLLNRMYMPESDDHASVFDFLVQENGVKVEMPEAYEEPTVDAAEQLPQLLTAKGLVSDVSYSNRIVTINFGEQYNSMDNVSEVLFRTAIVKTVSQVEQVDYVSFNVNMQPLTTSSGGMVGLMNGASFISDTGDDMDNLEWADVKLYFADETGQTLVPENLQMAYDRSETIEQAVVERLLNGPVEKSYKRTIPSGTKLLGISVKDGVAYVNFDAAFVDNTADVSPEVTIYSIVNSLCELNSVKKVQILVNGAQDGTFRDNFPLSSTYERNLDILSGNLQE